MTDDEWRPSTHQGINDYYKHIFPKLTDKIPFWITPNGPKQYALALREPHPTRGWGDGDAPNREFIRRDTRNTDNPEQIFIHSWEQLCTFFQRPAARDPLAVGTNRSTGLIHSDSTDAPKPVPKAVYYGLDNWEQFWVLAFDIDAKDIAKKRLSGSTSSFTDIKKGDLLDHGVHEEPPKPKKLPPKLASGDENNDAYTVKYLYRYEDIEQAISMAFDLKEWLLNTVGFEKAPVVYTGQGAHIYAFKDDPQYKFTKQTREFLAGTYITERLRIPIDSEVTWDQSRVMRLPWGLHSDVNRVVQPIDSRDFDYRNKATIESVLNRLDQPVKELRNENKVMEHE